MNLPTILVEDNRDDEELTRLALEDLRVRNTHFVVRNGADALDYLFAEGKYAGRDLRDQPALVMLELKLPKVSGLDVLRRLRADSRTRDLPIVIFTSSKEERDVVQGYRLGASSYVQKPLDVAEFNEAVKTLGLYWGLFNERPPPPAAP